MRLDRFLAKTIFETRTTVKKYIRQGRVFVNDQPIYDSGYILDLTKDKVSFDDNVLTFVEFYYFLLNKPSGYVCANVDGINPTVISLDPLFAKNNLNTVGRLDKDTTGALLLTNNGDLAHKLISPKHNIPKLYEVVVDKTLDKNVIKMFENGININDEYTTLPAKITLISANKAEVTLREGKYHQVKRMFTALGYEVTALHRLSFANLTVDDLQVGQWRALTETEIEALLQA